MTRIVLRKDHSMKECFAFELMRRCYADYYVGGSINIVPTVYRLQ